MTYNVFSGTLNLAQSSSVWCTISFHKVEGHILSKVQSNLLAIFVTQKSWLFCFINVCVLLSGVLQYRLLQSSMPLPEHWGEHSFVLWYLTLVVLSFSWETFDRGNPYHARDATLVIRCRDNRFESCYLCYCSLMIVLDPLATVTSWIVIITTAVILTLICWLSACALIKVALRSRCGHYIFVLWFLLPFPRLISAVTGWMSTILLHMVWP